MTLPEREGVPAGHRHAAARLAVAVVGALVLTACFSSIRTPVDASARVLLTGAGDSGSPVPANLADETAAGQKNGSFRIAGSAAKLYPGATVPLVLTVTNPQKFVIVVTSLTVKVSNASAKCAGTNLTVSAFAGKLSVPAHASAKATLHLSMHFGALDACEGAKFPLSFHGLARKA